MTADDKDKQIETLRHENAALRKENAELLAGFDGVLVTDHWGGYNFFGGLRQICWAYLKRDFLAIGEARERLGEIGRELHELSKRILALRRRVRDGTLQ